MEGLHWVRGEAEGVLMSRWRWLSHVEGGWSCICSLRCCSAQPAAGAGLAAVRVDLPLPVAASPARASLTAGLYCVRDAAGRRCDLQRSERQRFRRQLQLRELQCGAGPPGCLGRGLWWAVAAYCAGCLCMPWTSLSVAVGQLSGGVLVAVKSGWSPP